MLAAAVAATPRPSGAARHSLGSSVREPNCSALLESDLETLLMPAVATEAAPETSHAPAPVLLDVDAVAAMCNCSTRHVYRMADGGKMPRPVKLGALVRWNRDVLVRWFADGCPIVKPAKTAAR